MDWPEFQRSEWISAAAVLISFASATFTWRNFRLSARKEQREQDAKKPLIEAPYCKLDDQWLGWAEASTIVRNRSDNRLFVTGIKVVRPRKGRVAVLLADGSYKHQLHHFPGRWFQPPFWEDPIPAGSIERASRGFSFHLKAFECATTYSVVFELEERLEDIRSSKKLVKIKVPALKASAPSDIQSARDI